MPASRLRRLRVCWALLSLLCLGRLTLVGAQPAPPGPFAREHRIDPNRASIPELMTLPGMGRARAAAVVLHRVRHGPFPSIDALAEVDGLGPVTVDRLRCHLVDPARR